MLRGPQMMELQRKGTNTRRSWARVSVLAAAADKARNALIPRRSDRKVSLQSGATGERPTVRCLEGSPPEAVEPGSGRQGVEKEVAKNKNVRKRERERMGVGGVGTEGERQERDREAISGTLKHRGQVVCPQSVQRE